jgi:hypothetical protein
LPPTKAADASSAAPSRPPGNFSFAVTDQMVSLGGPLGLGCKRCAINGAINRISSTGATSGNETQKSGNGWVSMGMNLDAELDFEFAFKTVNGQKLINLVPGSVTLVFSVPLLATVTLMYLSNIDIQWDIGSSQHLEAAQNVTFGFEFHIPKNSAVNINIYNRTKSSVIGL